MNFNPLDYAIIIILIVSVLIGCKKGFLCVIGGILSTLAGIIIAFIFRYKATDYLQEKYGIVSVLTLWIEKHLLVSTGISLTPNQTAPSMVNEGLTIVNNQITEFAYLLVAAICFLLLYMLSSHLLRVIWKILEKILGWGILRGINRSGGGLLLSAQNTIIMATILGIIRSPLAQGSELGIKNFSILETYLRDSLLLPYLLQVFVLLQTVVNRFV